MSSTAPRPTLSGRVWKFGDDINTDLLMPTDAMFMAPEEAARAVFRANRPGWVDQVEAGDLLLGGRNFGVGSSRPAARSLKLLGLAAVVADSTNGLFFRNAINFGLPVIECPGVSDCFAEGEIAAIDFENFTVTHAQRGITLQGVGYPDALWRIVAAGGMLPLLRAEGYVP